MPLRQPIRPNFILQQDTLQSFYENVLVQSLRLAHSDFERGEVEEERLARMRSVAAEIIDDLDGA